MIKDSQAIVRQVDKKRTLAFGLVMLLIMLITTCFSGYLFLALQKNEEDRLASTIGTILSESINRISFSGKYHSRLLLEEMQKKLPELAYISVETLDGMVEAHTDSTRNDTTVNQPDRELSRQALLSGSTIVREKMLNGKAVKEVLLLSHAGFNPEPTGVVRVGIRVDKNRRAQQDKLLINILMSFILTGSAVWILHILSRHFSRRLSRAEAALRESEYRYRSIVENIQDTFYRTDQQGLLVLISPSGAKMLGYGSAAEMIGRPNADFWLQPEKRLEMLEVLKQEGVLRDYEVVLVRKDGSPVDVSTTTSYYFDQAGHILGVEGIIRDITERKLAEEALRESEARFKALHNASFGGICIHDKGIILECNQGLSEISGYSATELIGMNGLLLISEKTRDFVVSRILSGYEKPYEAIGLRKNNEEYPVRLEARNIPYKGKNVRITEFRDITDVKQSEAEKLKLENQLQQALKMEAIGQLAGGVAHDFNNMLGVIMGYTELILEQENSTQQFHVELVEIQKAAQHSADLTRQLLTFARKQTVAPRVLDLNQTVEGMLKMLRRLIGENIKLVWMPGTGLWPIKMDPSQIDQILANLCVNARDAIAGVGTISVETENATIDENYGEAHAGVSAGEYVRIAVSDTGSGMAPETLAHIFEPFFTTKGVGEGTGLGLATVYGAVKQNNGFINTYSELGQGTTVTIYIPRYVVQEALVRTAESAVPILRGHEVIMLTEDEPSVLRMTQTMLESLGYTVLVASTPSEAIRRVSEYAGQIHLLATDVIMPEMNGRELSERFRASRPEMKHLFMSGYTANIIANQGVLKEGMTFIQKPFSINELATKVREALAN